MKDGDLRPLFRSKIRNWQWTSIETAGSATGVPDSEFCTPIGISGWLEFKHTKAFYVHISPLQIAWLLQRDRYGGRAFIAVRRIPKAAKYEGVDELWLMKGSQAETLHYHGLESVIAQKWDGGPSKWNWDQIINTLQS